MAILESDDPSRWNPRSSGGGVPHGRSAGLARQSECGRAARAGCGRALYLVFSLFGEMEDGTFGVPFWVPPEVEPDSVADPPASLGVPGWPRFQMQPMERAATAVSFTERTGTRAGLEYRRGEIFLGAALLSIEADSLQPIGLPTDRGGPPTLGGSQSGFELAAALPLNRVLSGLSLRGSTQFWSQTEPWRYLPERSYEARLSLHNVYFESGNLELWTDVGAIGREPMTVPSAVEGGLETVPLYQSWFARLQVRISSVRIFVLWDNLTVRQRNQDYPGRILPQTRAMYGIRWTMWN